MADRISLRLPKFVSAGSLPKESDAVEIQELRRWMKDVIDFINPMKFGFDGNFSQFEDDGTLVFTGNATVWKDIMFPQSPPKTTGAGAPSLVTWNGNIRGFAYAINDAHDFDPQEIEHDAKVGSTATFHVHWVSRTNVGAERAVKWELEYAVETNTAIPSPTTASVEITIPANTPANTPMRDNITTFVIPNIARLVYARIKRVAASGTAPADDPVLGGVHIHYEIDSVGSRQIITK